MGIAAVDTEVDRYTSRPAARYGWGLLAARYDVVAILATAPEGPDPVPALFVSTWERLAPVLREMHTGMPGETAVRYLSFIAAADAHGAALVFTGMRHFRH